MILNQKHGETTLDFVQDGRKRKYSGGEIMKIDLLTKVFPGKSSAGALGLSTCVLIRTGKHTMMFDTGAHGVIKALY